MTDRVTTGDTDEATSSGERLIRQLRSTLGKVQVAIGAVTDAIVCVSSDAKIQWCNEAFAKLVGRASIFFIGTDVADVLPLIRDGERLSGDAHPVREVSAANRMTMQLCDARVGGRLRHLEATATYTQMGDDEASVVLVLHDVTERQLAQEQLTWNYNVQRVLDSILRASTRPPDAEEIVAEALDLVLAMPLFSPPGRGAVCIAADSRRAEPLFFQRGLSPVETDQFRRGPTGLCGCDRGALPLGAIGHVSATDDVSPHYCIPIMADGEVIGAIHVYVGDDHVWRTREDHFLTMVAETLANIVQRMRAETLLKQLAHSDSLTGLPNRALFYDRLRQVLSQAQRHHRLFGVLFVDLDHFKTINDTLGHDVGDDVLVEMSSRMRSCLRDTDTVARMGGDEFTIILTDINSVGAAVVVAGRIVAELAKPVMLQGEAHMVGGSVGVAVYPAHGADAAILLKSADDAMYLAKKRRNTVCTAGAAG